MLKIGLDLWMMPSSVEIGSVNGNSSSSLRFCYILLESFKLMKYGLKSFGNVLASTAYP